jgi:cellulose synthase/poly-beta-1,6-N-acetylglucosamine synthase-like glycosyltransferase
MFVELLAVFIIIYAIQVLIFAFGARNSDYDVNLSFRPKVSIIIAARNEEGNIESCLKSISSLTYPKDYLEVLIVNDRSTDQTAKIVSEITTIHSFIKLCDLGESESLEHLRGKTKAVAHGIEHCEGEIILLTDADCIVPESWVEDTVKYYSDASIGIVAGFTFLKGKNWFEFVQAIDWFFLYSAAAGMIRIGFPSTVAGNNLSFRREAYEAVGGFRGIPFSVTEDYALFHAITSQTDFLARFPLEKKTIVQSKPCSTLKELYWQKKRWFVGLFEMDAKRLLVFTIAYLPSLLIVLSTLTGELGLIFWFALTLKLSVDFALTLPIIVKHRSWSLVPYFLHFEFYYSLYVFLFPLFFLVKKEVMWKGRSFR